MVKPEKEYVLDRYEYSGQKVVEDAFVFLHGFPGRFTRNEDLAQLCAAKFSADSFVPQYRGLGRSHGEFLFSGSIQDAVSLIDEIAGSSKYKRINVIGHSWGGFVALSCLHMTKAKINKCMLLSPYTVAPPKEAFHPELKGFVEVQQLTGKTASSESLISDLDYVLENYLPDIFKGVENVDALFALQAAQDETMPATVNRQRFASLQDSVIYKEVPDNHWFTNRPQLITEVENFFKEGKC